jgi:hypothetical protein
VHSGVMGVGAILVRVQAFSGHSLADLVAEMAPLGVLFCVRRGGAKDGPLTLGVG